MSRQQTRLCGTLLVLGVVGTVVWVNAGMLNPPPGPVAPTMHTLDEVFNAVSSCHECSWNYKYVDLPSVQYQEVQVLPPGTNGLLHGIWLRNNNQVGISNGPFAQNATIGGFVGNATAAPTFFELNLQFTDGLVVRNDANTAGTAVLVIYRVNP